MGADQAAYVVTDRSVVEALRAAAVRGVKVRIWLDAGEEARLSEFDVTAQLGGQVQGLENSIESARRRTDAPERLVRRSSPLAHRLCQLLPVRRDAPGQ